MKPSLLPFGVALGALAGPLCAQPDVPPADPVVVTATRTAVTADASLAAVTVITREDIERTQAKSMAELLRGIAGIEMSESGGYGKTTSMHLRGTESSHVLVLVDGVRLGSATLGSVAWQHLPPAQIERIEIVRGPRSSLYGSDAIGGVVQIFTRRGGGPTRAHAAAGYGTYGTRDVSAGTTGGGGATRYSVAIADFRTDGFDAREPTPGPFGIDEPDDDGYRNTSLTLRAGHRFASGAEVEAHLLRAQGENEYDDFSNRDEFVQQAFGARAEFAPSTSWNVRLQAGQSRDESDNFSNGTFFSTFDTRRDTLALQNDLTIARDQLLTLGADYLDDRVESTEDFAVTERDNIGWFAQHQARFGRHDALLSLRRDDNEQFGRHTTGNLAWGSAFTPRVRAIAAFGTAYKAPTFNELYFPGFGNPDLRPEESRTGEIGLRGTASWGRWDVRAFQTDVDELIATVCDPVTDLCSPENVDRARIRGLETEIATELAGWRSALHLSFLDPRDVATDTVLPRRARQTARLDLDGRLGGAAIGMSVLAQSHRFDDAENTIRVGGYGRVDLRASYPVAPRWSVRARVENLLDKAYQTANTFNSARRSVFVSLAYGGE